MTSGVRLYRKGQDKVSVDSRHGSLQLTGYYNNVTQIIYRGRCPLVVVELTDRATTAKIIPQRNINAKGVQDFKITVSKYPAGHYTKGETTTGGNIAIYDYAEFGQSPPGLVALRLYNAEGLATFDSRKRPLEVINFAYKYLGVTGDWTWTGSPPPQLPSGKLGIVYAGIPAEGNNSTGWSRVAYYKTSNSKLGTRAINASRFAFNPREAEAHKNALLVKF